MDPRENEHNACAYAVTGKSSVFIQAPLLPKQTWIVPVAAWQSWPKGDQTHAKKNQ